MHNTTTPWVLCGLVGIVLGSLVANARPPGDLALASTRPPAATTEPLATSALAEYLNGSEWALDHTGALVRMEPVAVVLNIDDVRRVVRQVVMAENPNSKTAWRVMTFAITHMKREGQRVSLTAVANDGDHVAHTLQITAVGGKVRTHELWTTDDGKVLRSVHLVAARVGRLEVDQSMSSGVDSLGSRTSSGP